MRISPLLVGFILACTPTTTVIEGTNGDTGNANNGGDSDSDTDVDADTDTDTDADTDTGGKDTSEEPPDTSEGKYFGTIEGVQESDWGDMGCEGDVELVVDDRGEITGSATCEFDGGNGGGYDLDGDLEGSEAKGDVQLTWLVDYGRDVFEVDGRGGYEDGVIEVQLGYDEDWGRFDATIYVERQ